MTPQTGERTSTPILDRLTPLPSAEPQGFGRSEHQSPFVSVAIGTVILVTLVVMDAYRDATLSLVSGILQWFERELPAWSWAMRLAAVAVGALAALPVAIALHEAGHVLAGWCVGFRFESMRVGRLHLTRGFRWSWSRPVVSGAAGTATMLPIRVDRLGLRALALFAGGPAASLAIAFVLIALPFDIGIFGGPLVLWSLVLACINLVPFRSGAFASDGRRMVTLLRRPQEARRSLAMLVLFTDLANGAWPESLSSEYLGAAIAVRDDSADTLAAHLLAYLVRFSQRDYAAAAEALEICLGLAGGSPPALRESLMSEAAVVQARGRARDDLAQAWLDDIPADTTDPANRLRPEAAILEARGDLPGARRALDTLEARLRDRTDIPLHDLLLRLLRRWQTELEHAG